MSTRKKFFFVFLFIILDAFLITGFFVIRDATMVNIIEKETDKLASLDLAIDRFNLKVKTKGKYGEVEDNMKSYLDDIALSLQKTLLVVKNPELTKILSYENYKNDGPNFTKSLSFLEKSSNDFNTNIDSILNRLEDKSIKSYGKKNIDDVYYRKLFNQFMLRNDMKEKYNKTSLLLKESKSNVNHIFEISYQTLTFLVNHKDEWQLENNEIQFKTDELMNQYNSLIGSLNLMLSGIRFIFD